MHKLAQLCIQRPVFATMLVLALTVIGGFSFFGLGVDLLPKVDLPTIIVTIVNPGASPEQVETEIAKKVEDAVNTISGIDELRSTSREGSTTVVATFVLAKNGDVAAQEVRDKVNLILGDLPETAEAPIIQKLDPDAVPVMQVVVSAPRPLREVTDIADNLIKRRLENIDGVGEIRINGGRRREIRIRVDPDKMSAYRLTVTDVANALRLQNLELPGGRVNEGARELSVRAMGRIIDPKDFANIAVAVRGDYSVKIRDIGVAEDSAEEQRSAALLNDETAVTLVVSKQSGKNTVAVADAIKARVEEIRSLVPKDVRMEVIADQSVFIKAAVGSIEKHLIEGSLLAAIVIFFFLSNIRSTLIAAIAIPTSIISTFGLMAAMGYTLNQITMLALTLMVGIVIDDAIIVLENIYRYIEEKGMSPVNAAIEGTREIGLAVMATTLSLLAVFVPVGFMGGIVGRFMSSFGLTAAFAIAVSLLVSFTLTPMLCSRLFKKRKDDGHHGGSKESRFFRPIDRVYTRMLHWSMAHRKSIVAMCAIVVIAIVPMFMVIGKNFVPEDDQAAFEVSLRSPEGTSLPASINVATQVARDIRTLPGVTDTLTTIGGAGEVNSTGIYVKLTSADERKLSQAQLMGKTREILNRYSATLRTSVQRAGGLSAGARNADVQYVLTGPDLDKLSKYSDVVLAKMKEIPDVVDADTSLITGKPELRVNIDRKRAADLGVRVGDIAQALNAMVAGEVVSTFNAGTEQFDVRLQAAGDFRSGASGLKRLTIPSKNGPITLDSVVSIQEGTGPATIERMNRQRQVTISSNVAQGGSQAAIIAAMDTAVAQMGLAAGYTSGLAGLSKELGRSAYYFVLAITLSFIFMYMVLAAQFESFIHPVTILLTLPLAIPFGILSLLVMGQTVNIFSGLGLLLLFGIVKKNAILQIDHTNGLRATGMTRYDAIIQANRDRLRPILMTTIALVAGMLPLVVSSGPGAATNRSIGVLVVGGQSLCLLLTLLAVPVFYSYFEDLGEHPFWHRMARREQILFGHIGRAARSIGSRVGLSGLIICILAFLMATAATPANAQQTESFTLPPRVGITGEVAMSLDEAIRLVLENNNAIAVSRIGRDISAFGVTSSNGAFDPVFGLRSSIYRGVTPVSSTIGGSANGALDQRAVSIQPEVVGSLPWYGTAYQVSFSSARQTSDNAFTTLNPQYPAAISFNVTQPLGRNFKFDTARQGLAVSRKIQTLTYEQLRQLLSDSVTQTVQAYSDLVYANEFLKIEVDAVGLARDQVNSNQRMVDQGVSAPVDVIEARTQLATFEQAVYAAQGQVARAENNLKTLILANRNDPLWNSSLRPVTALNLTAPSLTLADGIRDAISARPEMSQVEISSEINSLNTRLYREQTKPQIDLVAGYTAAGLGGRPIVQGSNPFTSGFGPIVDRLNELSNASGLPPLPASGIGTGGVPTLLQGGYGQSLGNLFSGNFPTAQIGVNISLPFRNRTAEANLGSSLAEGRKIQIQKDNLEQLIQADVRGSMQSVESSQLRLRAAVDTRTFAEQQYESEQRKFQSGTSTVFLVLDRQQAMVRARILQLQAENDLSKAIADLDRATARTFAIHNITVQ